MTVKRFRVFNFPDVDKFGVSDDVAEVTVAFCDKKWEADYLSDLLNDLNNENIALKESVAYYKLLLESLKEKAERISQIR